MTQEEETQETTQEQEVPTPEEQAKALQEELGIVKEELEQTKKGLSTAHSRLTEKDKEFKRQSDLRDEIDGLRQTQKLLAAMIAERTGLSEEELEQMPASKKQNLLDQYNQIEKQQEEERKKRQTKTQQEEYGKAADSIWKRFEALDFTESDDEYWYVYDALAKDGNLKKAEAKVAKLEATRKPEKEEGSTETADQMEERIRKKILEEEGLTKTESLKPSGRSRTVEEAMAKFADGEISEEEARKAGVKFV